MAFQFPPIPAFGQTNSSSPTPFGAPGPRFGQTSSSSSTPFGAPNKSSSVVAENIPSPFGSPFGNSPSFGGSKPLFGSTNSSASTPLFGSTNSSAVNFNSSTTSLFGAPSSVCPFGSTSASGNTSAFGATAFGQTSSSSSTPFGAPIYGGTPGSTNSFFGVPNEPKTSFGESTKPSIWSTPASEKTNPFGVKKTTGHVPVQFSSPFCSNTSTGNSLFSMPAFGTSPFGDPASSVFPTGLTPSSLSQPSQASNSSTLFKEVGNQTINGQQQQPANPFGIKYEIDGPNAVITIENGTSTIQITGEMSSLTIRHVSSKQDSKPAGGVVHSGGSSEPCFINSNSNKYCTTTEIDSNGHIGQITSISAMPIYLDKSHEELRLKDYEKLQCASIKPYKEGKKKSGKVGGKGSVDKASFKINVNEIEVDAAIKKREADVLALMPKLPNCDNYYTEPCIKDLAAKEMAEPGFCSRVNDFVVGRKDYGSIKFLGETDIRILDIESVIRFNNREVIVYPDDRKKPPAGKSLNKPAEVTLLNVKCVSKKTGKEYVDGFGVQSYKEMLIKKASENGAEFVSYDPIKGEWKFRVQHF